MKQVILMLPFNDLLWGFFKSIEDEYHFVIICPVYRHLCLRYLPKYYCSWPKISIFLSFIQTSSRPLLF
jgi:hypothetical protein